MKRIIFPALLSLALIGCASVEVKKTYVASGDSAPKSIYIRPFSMAEAVFTGDHGTAAERDIRKSLAPAELSIALKQELSHVAPTLVLKDGETADEGWIVEGNIDLVDGGSRAGRFFLGHLGVGQTRAVVHVRVIDATRAEETGDGKSGETPGVIYAFDVESGSRLTGKLGSVYSSGAGNSPMFDYRNIAEEVTRALTPDPYRYGVRGGITDR